MWVNGHWLTKREPGEFAELATSPFLDEPVIRMMLRGQAKVYEYESLDRLSSTQFILMNGGLAS